MVIIYNYTGDLMDLRPEKYKGLVIVFYKEHNKVIAGFENNPHIVSGHTKEEAFGYMKEVMSGMSKRVLHTYMKHEDVIKALEVL